MPLNPPKSTVKLPLIPAYTHFSQHSGFTFPFHKWYESEQNCELPLRWITASIP